MQVILNCNICLTYTNFILGVYCEYTFDQLKESDQQWIQDIYFFNDTKEKYLVLCCTYAQAKAFIKARFLQMDLAFKAVKGKTNVFSVAGWNPDIKRKFNIYSVYVYSLFILI